MVHVCVGYSGADDFFWHCLRHSVPVFTWPPHRIWGHGGHHQTQAAFDFLYVTGHSQPHGAVYLCSEFDLWCCHIYIDLATHQSSLIKKHMG